MTEGSGASWEVVRFALILSRAGSIAAAARALGVDATTVSRRLSAMEEATGAPLFLRPRSVLRATELGARMVQTGERVEGEMLALERVLASNQSGTRVRIAMTEAMALQLVSDGAERVRARLADLELELVVGNQVTDLSRREADIALRLVRPTAPDLHVKLLGRITFGLYASSAYLRGRRRAWDGSLQGHDVVMYAGPLAESPEGRWMQAQRGTSRVAVACSSLVVLQRALMSGLGVGVLPRHLGATGGLQQLALLPEIKPREVFLVVHRDMRGSKPVRRCAQVLEELFKEILSLAPR